MRTKLERIGRNFVPASMSKYAKRLVAYPRYWQQLRQAQQNYQLYGQENHQSVLFVAGLPKSGTTWLESMLSTFPGFSDLMLPEAVAYEQRYGESHTFQLADSTFQRLAKAQLVLKLHLNGTAHNVNTLRMAGLRWVVLFRDLRDVAVSYIFYVQRTTYHPDHRQYAKLSTKEALHRFANHWLPQYVQWVNSWQVYADTDDCLILTYETLRNNPEEALARVVNHYRLGYSPEAIANVVAAHNFRKKAQKDGFYRKGISGDWANHFGPALRQKYQQVLGDFLIDYGYESNSEWVLP